MTYFTGQKILQKTVFKWKEVVEQRSVNCYWIYGRGRKGKMIIFPSSLSSWIPWITSVQSVRVIITLWLASPHWLLQSFFIFRDHDISCGFAAHTTITHITHMVWSLTHFFVFFLPKTLTFWHLKLRVHTISYHRAGFLTRVEKKHSNVVRLE